MHSSGPNRDRLLAGGILAAMGIERAINAYLLTGWAYLSPSLLVALALLTAGLSLISIALRPGHRRR